MRLVSYLIVMLLLVGCAIQEELPLKMKVTQIEVFTESKDQETSAILTITDPDKVSDIISELNQLRRTSFDDPEPPANIYKIIMRDNKNNITVFYYGDRVQFGGKIYTEKSARKGIGWKATERLAELLLEDKRKTITND